MKKFKILLAIIALGIAAQGIFACSARRLTKFEPAKHTHHCPTYAGTYHRYTHK